MKEETQYILAYGFYIVFILFSLFALVGLFF